ncbi:hypothetical protein SpiBuddy_1723 [Sphaerochaeta globosa str. Buddy]|uniref:Serine protease n=2 Tax=Sphaerochaeta TaxID=399320 RepID=F0RZJ6_SPHGB|nr:hypothetical protein SpiBuddy_1723 [Sphaerochaeta globosa str. Buddy]
MTSSDFTGLNTLNTFVNQSRNNLLNYFCKTCFVLGKFNQSTQFYEMLGTCFLIKNNLIATSTHVIGGNTSNLFIFFPEILEINSYQDVSNTECKPIPAEIVSQNPFSDITILKTDISYSGNLIPLGSFDDTSILETLWVFGFPHCVEGRRVFTAQQAELGAKILLSSSNIKSKFGVLNIQSRPGQSGSIVFSPTKNKIVGMLAGAYAIDCGISLGGINPRELNQTTQCISAEYISEMLEE